MTMRLLHVQQSLFQYKLMTISENKFLPSKEQHNSSKAIPITEFQPYRNAQYFEEWRPYTLQIYV